MSGLSRRDLLQALGGVGVCALAGCGPYPGPKPLKPVPEGWDRGEERWVLTTCGQCPAGCGVRARVYEGLPVGLQGNPLHPVNQGGLGPKGHAALQLLYHPDRIQGPLRRVGARGAGQWQRISWEEAIAETARRLADLRASGAARSVAVVDGLRRGLMRELWGRFLRVYGSPNHVTHDSSLDGGDLLAMRYMQGASDLPAYDWENAGYVLGFGTSLFESWCQTLHLARGAARMRQGRPGRRAKLVQVSPRFSVTAARSDEWVPIEPAAYGALALGIAHVLVREKLYDEAFVRDHTFGFEPWKDEQGVGHEGFRDLLARAYSPEAAARVTGVEAKTIVRLAREMAGHRPAIAVSDGGATAASNGLPTAMAIHALNALLGSLERPGGLRVHRPAALASWPEPPQDDVAEEGAASSRIDCAGDAPCPLGQDSLPSFAHALSGGASIGALFFYCSNPFFSKPGGARWAEAVRRVPFVVSFSPLPDESTQCADLVLPDCVPLERWEIVEAVPSVGRAVLGLRQPVTKPLHDTLSTGDVVCRLARALGGPVAAALPWATFQEACEARIQGVVDPKKLRAEGCWAGPPSPDEKWDEAFRTPSGKFEFYSKAIAERLAAAFPDPAAIESRVSARGDELCLPHWEPARQAGDPAKYPLALLPYRGIGYAEGGMRHLPWLRELPLSGMRAWRERVELAVDDARALGVETGDLVRVETPAGRRQMTAIVSPAVRPGTLCLPLGQGAWPVVQGDTGTYGLIAEIEDPLSGLVVLEGTRARVVKEEA